MQDPLKILLDTDQPEERRIDAAKALAKTGDAAVIDRMFAATERAETLLTRAIVEALKEMKAHEVLIRRLADANAAVRADGARKLSKMQDPRAADALIGAARDKEAVVRRAVVHALSYLKGAKVYDALAAALRDPDPETRAYAAAGIGRSGDPRASRALVAAREVEEDDVVKDFIDAALRKIPHEPAGTR
jgi:HEAT repeat protein